MNNVQIFLTVGIPTFAILVGILMNVIHHSSVNSRFNSVDSRFSSLEGRFSSLDGRFNSVDARFNNLEVKFDTLIGKVIDLDNGVTRIEAKLDIR
jgi:hypothetical protein